MDPKVCRGRAALALTDIKAELADSSHVERQAAAASKVSQRLLELARDFGELWNEAKDAEKKEFVTLLVSKIEIDPDSRRARMRLNSNYLSLKAVALQQTRRFLSIGRGEWI